MSDTAIHLVASVLPEVPVRHWVCSFPWGVRAVLGYDKELCRVATRAFAKEVSQSLKRRAKQKLKLHSVSDALTGLVAVVQRTDGALRLNVHLHCLGLDGVYVRDAKGALDFHELPTPRHQGQMNCNFGRRHQGQMNCNFGRPKIQVTGPQVVPEGDVRAQLSI